MRYVADLLTKQINISISEQTRATLDAIAAKHGTPVTDVCRRLIEEACLFFDQHGWFTFPVRIEPEAFQARYVAENPGAYGSAISDTELLAMQEKARQALQGSRPPARPPRPRARRSQPKP